MTIKFLFFFACLLLPSLAYAAEPELPSYGWLLFKTVLALAGVCVLAVVGLRWLSKMNLRQTGNAMSIIARLPVEPRRSILVVKVGERGLIISSSESGMTTLGELTADELRAFETSPETLPESVLKTAEGT